MHVIVTGAAGFIGSCFVAKLNSLGIDRVIAVDSSPTDADHPNLRGKKITEYLPKDALLERLAKGQFQDVELIVHLGACSDTTEMDRAYLTRNNLEYSRTLAQRALERNRAFHYASSASVYGDGALGYADSHENLDRYKALNPYAESKLLFDRWVVSEGVEDRVVGYRYFNVFGPNEYHKGHMRSMVAKAFDQIREGGRVKLFASTRPGFADGSEERDFVYVKDVNDIMSFFVEHPDRHGIFNVGSGKARSFKDLALAVFTALGKEPAIDFVPMPDRLRGQYQYFTEADLSKLRKAGYVKPLSRLEDAVRDYVTYHLSKKDPYL